MQTIMFGKQNTHKQTQDNKKKKEKKSIKTLLKKKKKITGKGAVFKIPRTTTLVWPHPLIKKTPPL